MDAIVFIILQIFFTRPNFGRPFLKAFKRQRNSVSAQNIICLFLKVFSLIHFNNLLGIKTKHANVNCKVLKLGNITWGIFNNYSTSARWI